MQEKQEKERLNLYLSQDLLKRLEYCSERYGVSRTQLAVMCHFQTCMEVAKFVVHHIMQLLSQSHLVLHIAMQAEK